MSSGYNKAPAVKTKDRITYCSLGLIGFIGFRVTLTTKDRITYSSLLAHMKHPSSCLDTKPNFIRQEERKAIQGLYSKPNTQRSKPISMPLAFGPRGKQLNIMSCVFKL